MSNRIRAELHSHSTYSDGAFEPAVVAQLCADRGVKVWSLTDHDTCLGCREAAEAAARLGIEFIAGIEVSAFADRSIHVLGYGVDPESAVLAEYSKRRLQARRDRMRRMIDKLAELGVPIEYERVAAIAGEGAIARPHLARALVEAGHVTTVQEAFDKWISNEGAAYVETPWPKVPDAIALIHEAGGVAVLAHPGIYHRDALIAGWIEAGLDGIEARHPKHTAADEARYRAMADAAGLLVTGSSDYHGPEHLSASDFGRVELEAGRLDALRAVLKAR